MGILNQILVINRMASVKFFIGLAFVSIFLVWLAAPSTLNDCTRFTPANSWVMGMLFGMIIAAVAALILKPSQNKGNSYGNPAF
jgi:hypothetical protein